MKDRNADPLAPTPEVVRKRSTRESLAQPATLTAGLAMVARRLLVMWRSGSRASRASWSNGGCACTSIVALDDLVREACEVGSLP